MARDKHRRSSKRHSKRHSKSIINKTVDQTMSVVKTTSKKYMPKVKSGLENVGSKVVKTGEQSIPFLQQMTRKFFGMFSTKSKSQTKKHRRR
jgi:hypothetical protein